ncbi:hypothetical protein ENUP19_0050G0013 [Entamoeba nuttalli]|uniref:EamA domain-containing protein n=1 Tax=Entamoeba nuttalli TaxID=412467 RepID=A0ABQ0DBK4_9EUKA
MEVIDDYINPKSTTIHPFLKVIQKPTLRKSVLTLCVIIFLLSGTLTITLSKLLYNTTTKGRYEKEHQFEHPMFLTFMMFVGMMLCLFIHIIMTLIIPEDDKKNYIQINKRSPFRGEVLFALIGPALCDFLGGYLMNVGLMYVTSSVFQMMRGSVIIFTALLTVFVRKSQLKNNQIFAIFLVIIALAVVGGSAFAGNSSVIKGESKVWDVVIGISFITSAMFLQALQTIMEEKYLQDLQIPPLVVVGLEGFYGILLSVPGMILLQMVPIPFYDDNIDAIISLREKHVLIVVIIYAFSVTLFNITGMIITRSLTAMVRNILDPCRMISIWFLSVLMYYIFNKKYGEPLGWQTALQVLGFLLLTFGLFIYTGVIKLNFFGTENIEQNENIVLDEKSEDNNHDLFE